MIRLNRLPAIVALAAMAVAGLSACGAPVTDAGPSGTASHALSGPLAWLLDSSTDLGPGGSRPVAAAVALRTGRPPSALRAWAAARGLHVDWQPGATWAELSGTASGVGSALGVRIDDYRSRSGHTYYAADRQAGVPGPLRREVSQIGRLANYGPRMLAARDLPPRSDVPQGGLNPTDLVNAYDATALQKAVGNTTSTVVFFEFDGFDQADLDAYSKLAGLPRFTPTVIGGQPGKPQGEATMDLEVVHAIAPDARLVVINAVPTLDGNSGESVMLSVSKMFAYADQHYPGAVWSLSIGWGCEQMYTAADLRPVEAALETAESHGTSAYDASGDTAGLECKGNGDYSTPPNQSDVGVDAVAALPGMTSVGGTLLSTDAHGDWSAEEAWDASALSQGGSGGVSANVARPPWQNAAGMSSLRGAGHRLVPDVSADADPYSGVEIVMDGSASQGGGTSQAAPIWAGFTLLMDAYLGRHGAHSLGAINPLLYRVAQGSSLPPFHDITLGGDAVDMAGPGYDLVTGLGTPLFDNLVQDLATAERSAS